MNARLLVLYPILLGFMVFTVYSLAVTDQPFLEWAGGLMRVPATAQVVIDLYIACGLIVAWMYCDALRRGKSIFYWMLFVVITLFAASIGPLLYLILREHQSQASAQARSAQR